MERKKRFSPHITLKTGRSSEPKLGSLCSSSGIDLREVRSSEAAAVLAQIAKSMGICSNSSETYFKLQKTEERAEPKRSEG